MKLEDINRGLAMNAQAYDRIKSLARAGITELELLHSIEDIYAVSMGHPIEYIYDLISGPRSGDIAGSATERRLEPGDFIIVDLLPNVHGSWSDTTRTFFLGEPSPQWRSAYNAVISALHVGEACLRPGESAADIYETISASLQSQGFPPLCHHAGHAVGNTPQDSPDFVKNAEGILQQGMIVTLEPGIYSAHDAGIRVENNYLITAEGYDLLFTYPLDIQYFIV
jgi:Xaa-Pro aminopeptidase